MRFHSLREMLLICLICNAYSLTPAQQRCSNIDDPDIYPQYFDAEPNMCYLYSSKLFTPDQRTLQYSKQKCMRWATEYSFSCTLVSPINAAKMTEYLDNSILVSYMRCWLGLQQTNTSVEPGGGWFWQLADGSQIPADGAPWSPGQPDNNGGSSNQGVYNGGAGISDDNASLFASQVNSIQCECVVLPQGTNVTGTVGTTTTPSSAPNTTPTSAPTTSTQAATSASSSGASSSVATTTSSTPTTAPPTTSVPTTATSPTISSTASTASTTSSSTTTAAPVTTTASLMPSTTMATSTLATTTQNMMTTSTARTMATSPASACTIYGVDPMIHMSSANYMIYPNVADCVVQCANETKFACQGFTWSGPRGSCVVFGKIDRPAVLLSGSKWFLVDYYCNSGQPCHWPLKASQIDPTSISAASIKNVQAQNAAHCQTECLLVGTTCKAYAFSTDATLSGGNNCYLFPVLSTSQISAASTGKFDLYQSACN